MDALQRTIRTDPSAEHAHAAAARLSGAGLRVQLAPAVGSGPDQPALELAVAVEDVPEAERRLERIEREAHRLHLFVKFSLWLQFAYLIAAVFIDQLQVARPPTVAELDRSASLILWQFCYESLWHFLALNLAAIFFCLRYHSFGRGLLALLTGWSVITTLAVPAQAQTGWFAFFGAASWTLGNLSLAIMYLPPLRQRFRADDGTAS